MAQTTTASFGPSVSFFVLFLVFLNQLTVFLHFADYELLPTMGANVIEATLLPIQIGCKAINTGEEGAEGCQETLGGDTCEVCTLCTP
jgi:hypothetical protein